MDELYFTSPNGKSAKPGICIYRGWSLLTSWLHIATPLWAHISSVALGQGLSITKMPLWAIEWMIFSYLLAGSKSSSILQSTRIEQMDGKIIIGWFEQPGGKARHQPSFSNKLKGWHPKISEKGAKKNHAKNTKEWGGGIVHLQMTLSCIFH